MGVVAFWIAVAAVLIAGGWFKSRSEAQKQQTLRTIIEKTGAVDEALLRQLFPSPPSLDPSAWGRRSTGDGYRALKVLGTIAMCVAAGLMLFYTPLWLRGIGGGDTMVGVAIGVVGFAAGAGFFLAARFAERPPERQDSVPPPR
jgi:hypothetical protein